MVEAEVNSPSAQNDSQNERSPDYRISEQETRIRELQERQEEELAEEKAILHYLRHETYKYLWCLSQIRNSAY